MNRPILYNQWFPTYRTFLCEKPQLFLIRFIMVFQSNLYTCFLWTQWCSYMNPVVQVNHKNIIPDKVMNQWLIYNGVYAYNNPKPNMYPMQIPRPYYSQSSTVVSFNVQAFPVESFFNDTMHKKHNYQYIKLAYSLNTSTLYTPVTFILHKRCHQQHFLVKKHISQSQSNSTINQLWCLKKICDSHYSMPYACTDITKIHL